ncbi:NUDIX domain-containing protein [uncultured Planococcus sp.]|uniref:NUDIX hydrolase n=1 Tax=uncultured Planococcus sp. TaxID=337815 RepID=UPI00261C81F1|nr:NUDIX domain-containing protein [uncultured Planococcus sp.]
MRDRSAVILIKHNKLGLIKRVKNGNTYYVFPGGGIEDSETPEITAKREAMEETGLEVEIQECFVKIDFHGTQYFFLATIVDGEFGSGNGEEFNDDSRNRGTYLPVWVDISKLNAFDVKPKEVARKIQALFSC